MTSSAPPTAPSKSATVFAGAFAVGLLGLSWWMAKKWSTETQVAASVLTGIAVFAVTWRYTKHTGEMVKTMRDEQAAAAQRYEDQRAEDVRRDQLARAAAARAMAIELREMSRYIDELRAHADGGGTKPPYPPLQLVTLDAFASHMAQLPDDCSATVLAVHYQLLAANARAGGDGYWHRAGFIKGRADAAIAALTPIFGPLLTPPIDPNASS